MSLTGLCAGGGGAWGGLKVEGLEKALLAQVLSKMVSNQHFSMSPSWCVAQAAWSDWEHGA